MSKADFLRGPIAALAGLHQPATMRRRLARDAIPPVSLADAVARATARAEKLYPAPVLSKLAAKVPRRPDMTKSELLEDLRCWSIEAAEDARWTATLPRHADLIESAARIASAARELSAAIEAAPDIVLLTIRGELNTALGGTSAAPPLDGVAFDWLDVLASTLVVAADRASTSFGRPSRGPKGRRATPLLTKAVWRLSDIWTAATGRKPSRTVTRVGGRTYDDSAFRDFAKAALSPIYGGQSARGIDRIVRELPVAQRIMGASKLRP